MLNTKITLKGKTPNPYLVPWGVIVITKNSFELKNAWFFRNIDEKIIFLKIANKIVIIESQSSNKCQVSLHYGVSLNAYIRSQN